MEDGKLLWNMNIPEAWYNEGKTKDTFFRFMAYWMAFNFLYYDGYNPMKKEWEMINDYVCHNKHLLSNVFDSCNVDINILKHNRLNYLNRREREYYDNVEQQDEEVKIKALFNILYKIRCNLFHGNKSPYREKDILLVQTSANIMEKTLELLLHIN